MEMTPMLSVTCGEQVSTGANPGMLAVVSKSS